MGCPRCHEQNDRGSPAVHRIGRRYGWLLSGLIIVLTPKCPACVAIWVMAATGMTVSFATANLVRVGLLATAVTVLAWLGWRIVRGAFSSLVESRREIGRTELLGRSNPFRTPG